MTRSRRPEMMERLRPVVLYLALAVCAVALASPALAGDRYALIVTGASGGAPYAARYDQWRARLATALIDHLGFRPDHVRVLGETAQAGVALASAGSVRAALASFAQQATREDVMLVVLIGHGTFDGVAAKFNLVGPDLDASQWAAMLQPVRGQVIVVNTTSASFPFLDTLSRRGRVVITATDTRAARYDTVFPEYFVKAIEQAAVDAAGGGRVSIWDIFTAASAGVRRYYEQRGQLPVEHALLDDLGDGQGKDAERPGTDTAVAQAVYVNADPAAAAQDPATRALVARRDQLTAQIEELKARKASMSADDYAAQLERLLMELATVSKALRK